MTRPKFLGGKTTDPKKKTDKHFGTKVLVVLAVFCALMGIILDGANKSMDKAYQNAVQARKCSGVK